MNLRESGIVSVVFGALLMILAAFAYTFQQTVTQYYGYGQYQFPISYTTSPYRDYTFPIILCSIALFVMGFALIIYRTQQMQNSKQHLKGKA